LLSLTFFLTCEDKITDPGKFGAVHVEIVFNNDNSQNNKQSTNNGIESFTPKKELFRTIGKNIETDEVAEENIQGLHTEKDVNNSVLNKSLSGDITSITITISGVDPVNVDVSSGETVSKTIDGVPVGQQTVKIDLKDSVGTIIYTQTQTVEVTAGETSSPSFPAEDFTPENVSITVTSPNGGEAWELGSTNEITWTSSYVSGDVKIELYQNGSAYQIIEGSTDNDGSYSWTIPETHDEGTDYKINISSVSDATVYDESDANFTLSAATQAGNYSLSFDVDSDAGWGSAQDRIVVSDPNVPNPTAFTMSSWVFPETKPSPYNNRNLSIMGKWDGNGEYLFRNQVTYDGSLYFILRDDIVESPAGQVPFNSWSFVTTTYDGSVLKQYVDGQLINSETLNLTLPSSESDLTIGEIHMSNGHWYFWSGKLDDISIWDEAITDAEITALYNSGTPIDASSNSGNYTSSANLQAYWNFNEGTGSILTDQTSNGNDGTIYGATWSTDVPSGGTNPPMIEVTNPNGGEEWELGSSQNITWTSTNISGNVLISLFKGGSFYMSINTNTSDDGSYSWTIPSSYDEADNYKIRISYVSDENEYDESDDNFSLSADSQPTLTITSPNGGETWELGSSHSITWNSANLSGNYVGIQLYSSGSYVSSISSSTTDDGSYTWSISSSQTESDYYQVKIYSTSESSISDYSDSYFTIEEPTSSSCNTPTNLQTYSITTTSAVLDWGSVSGAISYNIMYRENGESWYMTSDITSSGANWSGLSANTTYQWQVQSDCGSTASSWSSIITFTTPDDGGGGGSNADCDDPYYCSDCDGCEGSCCPNYCSGFYYYYNRTCDGNGFCIGATSDYCPNGCNDNGCL